MSDARRDKTVFDGLAELRDAMANVEAPPEVRPAVLTEFRRLRSAPKRTGRGLFYGWCAVAASVALLASLIYLMSRPSAAPPARARIVTPAPVLPPREAEPVITAKAETSHQTVGGVRKRTRTRRPAAPKPSERSGASELATDFFLLPSAPPMEPGDAGQVIRVKLPRAAMRSVGLPVNEDRWYDPVPADVILGQDGVARAVRFVKVAH